MEPQDFNFIAPNGECLYFPYRQSLLPDNGTIYYANPSTLNGAVERRYRVKGDTGMAFVECDSGGNVTVIGKTYIVSIDNIVFETRVLKSEFNSMSIITISGLNGPNLVYKATLCKDKRRWNENFEDTSNAPWIFGIPTQDLTIEKIDNGNLITIDIYDPNGHLPRRFRVCFDWQKLADFSNKSEEIIKLDGISTILLKMNSIKAKVTSLIET